MQVIQVKSAIHNYAVYFSESTDFLSHFENIKNRFYVIDSNVWAIYSEKLFKQIGNSQVMILPVDENRKNLNTVMELYDALMSQSAKRNMTLISIGGGIVQDITGFAASTLYRGLNWIFVPTTLLAQADSCIGSKTSLNYKHYKNLVGTFFPPNEIYLNPSFLKTLRRDDFYSGLGEVIKLHLMGGKDTTQAFLRKAAQIKAQDESALLAAIKKSLEIKLGYLANDEFDMGRRNLLNFGHCFGHALESTADFSIPHGQAVLVGIAFANIIAKHRGLLSEALFNELNAGIIKPNITARLSQAQFDCDKIIAAMKMDKKRTGDGLALIMLIDDYEMIKVEDLGISELVKATSELIEMQGIT